MFLILRRRNWWTPWTSFKTNTQPNNWGYTFRLLTSVTIASCRQQGNAVSHQVYSCSNCDLCRAEQTGLFGSHICQYKYKRAQKCNEASCELSSSVFLFPCVGCSVFWCLDNTFDHFGHFQQINIISVLQFRTFLLSFLFFFLVNTTMI